MDQAVRKLTVVTVLLIVVSIFNMFILLTGNRVSAGGEKIQSVKIVGPVEVKFVGVSSNVKALEVRVAGTAKQSRPIKVKSVK